MAESSPLTQDDILRLCEEYTTPYHAIIREHVVMGVTRYFLERWVPVLGVAPATIVNTLRQLNFHTPEKPVVISGNTLAREAAMSRRHLYTCLETAWLAAFITIEPGKRTRTQTGKVLQEANRYDIRMDDPLSPADAYSLMLHLQKLAKNPIEAARLAMEQQPRNLWSTSLQIPLHHFSDPEPITAATVLHRAFPGWKPDSNEQEIAFDLVAGELHHHMILGRPDGRVSKIIVPQYFRTHWWKHLGHDLAWSYLWLRGAVYDNPGEGIARYHCWVPTLDTLLNLIQRPREWWRRNVERPILKNGVGGATDFFQQVAIRKGKDPEHPQSVARQFMVKIEIPIAPSDRSLYSDMLIEWPTDDNGQLKTTEHITNTTETDEVLLIQTHRQAHGVPHLDTPASPLSATFEHTEAGAVCHIQTHGSATFEHRDSESFKALLITSTQKKDKHTTAVVAPIAAGEEKKENINSEKSKTLKDLLRLALEEKPSCSLCDIATIPVWLQQAWQEPISPHTPAWTIITNGKIAKRDIVALILAIEAEHSIQHPPRYLSWLLQRWQANLEIPPVANWERWQNLASLSINDWPAIGYQEWLELAPSNHRELPVWLEEILQIRESYTSLVSKPSADLDQTVSINSKEHHTSSKNAQTLGLEALVANGEITIKDVWRAAMSQLSIKLHRSIYTNWLEGTHPVPYQNGVLTLRARHFMAREQLSRRYNSVVEDTVSDLAKEKITVRYVL